MEEEMSYNYHNVFDQHQLPLLNLGVDNPNEVMHTYNSQDVEDINGFDSQ